MAKLHKADKVVFEREDLELLLNDLGIQFKVHSFLNEGDGFVSRIQTEFFPSQMDLTLSEKCDTWIKNFSEKTNTNWIVKGTATNLTRKEYTKQYLCQHSSKNKSLNLTYKNNVKSRDKQCHAKIKISVKKVTKDTLKKDRLLKLGMVTIIKINFNHTHFVDVAEAYRFLRVSATTKEQFLGYFADGMSPAAAKYYHEVNIFTSEDDPGKKAETLTNAHINPTIRQIINLYENWRQGNYGSRNVKSVYDVITSKMKEMEAKGASIIVKEDPFIVVVLTPLMKRCHKQKFSSEIVFVDSSGSCDQSNTCVTFLFGASKIGGLPLGCILHSAQTEENYREGFALFRDAVGSSGFFNKMEPAVFMTDDSTAERKALKCVFPSSTLLLCTFHVTQALWRWLWDSKNNICQLDRKYLMNQFRKVLFEKKEKNCLKFHEDLLKDGIVNKYQSFKFHVEKLWQRKSEWTLCFRSILVTRGHNTNNIVEASIRIFKDIVLQRCKAFNAAALLEFVTDTLESYHTRRLLEFASKSSGRHTQIYAKLIKKSANLRVTKLSDTKYHVLSSRRNYVYKVDTQSEFCNCAAGHGGSFCKHLCAVVEKFGICMSQAPQLNHYDRVMLAKIAIGHAANIDFYKDMDKKSIPMEFQLGEIEQDEDSILDEVPVEEVSSNGEEEETMSDNFKDQLERLRSNHQRIEKLFSENRSSGMENGIRRLNNKLDRITTPALVESYSHEQKPWTMRRYIGVQPTSQGRRKNRPGLHFGLKRLQAGRPSNLEIGKVAKKRQRALGKNINLNCPNSKSHGFAH